MNLKQLRKDYDYVKNTLDWDCEHDIQKMYDDLLMGEKRIAEALKERIIYILQNKLIDLDTASFGGYGTVYSTKDNTKEQLDNKKLNNLRRKYLEDIELN